MEDRVAEVLSQRATLDTSAASGVVLSLALHAAITGLAVYAALHQKPPQMVNILSIRLAPMSAPATVTPAARPATKPAPKTLQEPQPAIEQPKTKPETKPEPKTVPFSPFGKSTKKGSEVAPPPVKAAPAATSSAGTAADVPLGGAGVTGLEGGDFPYTIYIERMKQLIGSHWFRPQVAAGTTTTVYFVIDRDGTIRDAKNETASGNGSFDRAALRAILETSPLPPLPFGYSGTYLGVHLIFK